MQPLIDLRAPHNPKRGIYLLPNLLTTGALFAGFFSIILALKGRYEEAATAIFVAMIFDSLDGRVARMTRTQSEFGAEYDSLSDLVSFGVAPALILYIWGLGELDKFGWLTTFFYVTATALRLARFNIIGSQDKRFFRGLPCPAAAGFVMSSLWVAYDYGLQGRAYSILFAGLLLVAAGLMISNFLYYSFKDVHLKHKVHFYVMLVMITVGLVVLLDPPRVLLAAFGLYALLGPMTWVRQRVKTRKTKH